MPKFDFPKNQIHPLQVPVIYKLAEMVKAKKVAEIGSWVGESTSHWAKAIKENDGEVYSIDWFKGNVGTDLLGAAFENDIYNIFDSNLKELGLRDIVHVFIMASTEAVKFVDDESMDIVFIDASHDYQSVLQDIASWYPKVRKGGIICGHDCEDKTWDERYINQDVHDHKHHGVIKAVCESFEDFNIEERIWWKIKST